MWFLCGEKAGRSAWRSGGVLSPGQGGPQPKSRSLRMMRDMRGGGRRAGKTGSCAWESVLWAHDHSVRPGLNAGAIEQQTSGLHMSARCTERRRVQVWRSGPTCQRQGERARDGNWAAQGQKPNGPKWSKSGPRARFLFFFYSFLFSFSNSKF